MSLATGTRLGHYQILSALGVGGMGEVYRARDTKLGRDVAIKVLRDAFAADPEWLARFKREARLLAALNHPHIGAIHGFEDADGVPALVLELVDGPTLADRLSGGAMPLTEALPIARQIAEALEAAHEKGIVHRDLKPGNIKVTTDGIVKVLDFGLAKAFTDDASADLSQSPTVTWAGTREGIIMGTPAYMSPEQARGTAVDRRTDIWAFGCVLFEMLTGRNPFRGDTLSDTVAAILDREPNWGLLPPGLPVGLARLLQRCLEKDPKRRLRDVGDAQLELEDRAMAAVASSNLTPRVDRRAWIAWTIAGAAMTALAGIAMWPRGGAPLREPLKFTFEPPDNVTLSRGGLGTVVSPDGRKVAFIGQPTSGATGIWVRSLDSQESQKVDGTDGASNPFWSPDGRFLGFFAQGKLRKIASDGGVPQNICTTTPGLGATWSPVDEIVFNPTNRAPLMRVSAAGGVGQQLTTLDVGRHENSHRWPSFLPDGRHFLFTGRANEKENTAIYVGSLDSKETKRLLTEQSNAVYAPPGYLLFGREGTLMAQRFDPDKVELSGEAFPVAGGIDQETPSANAFFSVSRDGSVITFHEATRSLDELTWFDREGKPQGVVGSRGLYGWPRLSPDGKRLAVWIPDPENGNRDIWIIDVATGTRTRFTSNPSNDWFPEWSPDGTLLTFGSDRTAPPSVYRKAVSGDREEERVVPPNESVGARLFWGLPGGITVPPFAELRGGSYSQTGNWMAYQSTKSGTREIYVRSLDGPDEHRISTKGGAYPRWRGDGKELFYVTPDNAMMAVEVSLREPFTSTPPRLLFHICSARRSSSTDPDYEVTRDGRRFLFSCQSQETRKRSITVAIRWLDMIKHPMQQERRTP